MKYLMEYDLINKSPLAPIAGVYRYELIPAEQPMDYYIDLWYVYGLGDNETLLASMEDTVYLEEGDRLVLDADGKVVIKKKEKHLKLVINNG